MEKIKAQSEKIPLIYTDFLIVGSGIAGLFTALKAARYGKVTVLSKTGIEECNTGLAQGGIAAAVHKEDSPSLHMEDTLTAGAGICDAAAVKVLVEEGPERVRELIANGAQFDKKDGQISLTREGAHSRARILHVADATGEAIRQALVQSCHLQENITFVENQFLMELIVDNQAAQCWGALIYDRNHKQKVAYISRAVILGTGGTGQLYKYTTNPEIATGDGMAAAYRCGAELSDLEFVQFHPTVFYSQETQRFLISESVRGEGGILYNLPGRRFMPDYHPLAELAPRDVVSRAILNEMKLTGSAFVYLDMRHVPDIKKRFPTIYATCLQQGIDISREYVPVSPAAHYTMGGIKTGLNGETNLAGLYACGEAACTGVHGANRLASNSLLEGIVFGQRIISNSSEIMQRELIKPEMASAYIFETSFNPAGEDPVMIKKALQEVMWQEVGIIRTASGLQKAREEISRLQEKLGGPDSLVTFYEVNNMLTLAALMVDACLWRKESRGGHFRSDYPGRDDAEWLKHKIFTKTQKMEDVNV